MPSRERLERHYDTKYKVEADDIPVEVIENKSFPSNRFEACLKFFPSCFNGGDILELGAGSGLIARSLIASNLEFNTYTLSEFSDTRLKGLQQSFMDPRVCVLKLDAESIPHCEFGKYDAIIMVALIEHLMDPLGAMMQIHDLLRPKGFVYIDTPNIAKFTRRVKLLVGRFPSTASKNEGLTTFDGNPVDMYDEGHLHYFTYRSLSLMLTERCGFSKVEKFAYFNGRRLLGIKLDNVLARLWPGFFSELVLVAYA